MSEFSSISPDVKLGQGVKLSKFINLYGCQIGDDTKIGAFVEIQKNARVGKRCKISSHTFICEGVTIEDNVSNRNGMREAQGKAPGTPRGRVRRFGDRWRPVDASLLNLHEHTARASPGGPALS